MLSSGQLLHSRYRIEGYLGGGGFGLVYRAYDLETNIPARQTVAIKQLHTLDDQAVQQFTRESNLLAGLSHYALPTVLDFFIEDAVPYLVMIFVPGEDVGQRLKRHQRLPEAEALAITRPILDALQYLHGQHPPILHRDIKPENIRVTPENQVFLVDFGLAKASDVTQTMTVGTAVSHGYSPPEQYYGETDHRSDLYALGATLYKMLSGIEAMPRAIDRMRNDPLKPLRRLNPEVSFRTAAAVDRLLMLAPEQRYQNVASLRADLPGHELRLPPVALPRPLPPGRAPRRLPELAARLGRRGMVAAAGLALLVLASIVWLASSLLGPSTALTNPTAQAQATMLSATATVQPIQATAAALQQELVFPKVNGSLTHKDADLTSTNANVSLLDFDAQVTFFNPYDRAEKAWDYGFIYRWVNGRGGYLLKVDSDKNWALLYYDGSRDANGVLRRSVVAREVVAQLDVSAQGANQLQLVVAAGKGYFFVNNAYVTAFDLSKHQTAGDIYLFTGYAPEHRLSNRTTMYEGFTISASQAEAAAHRTRLSELATQVAATAQVQVGATATAQAQAAAAAVATAQAREAAAATAQAATAATAQAQSIAGQQRLAIARGWPAFPEESFDSASRGWATGASKDNAAKPSVDGGKYTWNVQGGPWVSAPISEPGPKFYVKVTARRLSGPTSTYYGLILHEQTVDNNVVGYFFRINDDKTVFFYVHDKDGRHGKLDANSNSIEAGKENTLEVVVEDTHFYFYVNGEYIDTREDATFSSGSLGVWVWGANEATSQVEFDDFVVRRPQ